MSQRCYFRTNLTLASNVIQGDGVSQLGLVANGVRDQYRHKSGPDIAASIAMSM
jgi:hypothetical protein